MTLFVASVSGPEAAEIALSQGADVIDLHEPSQGALGAPAPDAVRATVARVAGRRPVWAFAGTLPMAPDAMTAAVSALIKAGVDSVTVGVSAGPEGEACIRALAPIARRTKLIGAMRMDEAADRTLLSAMAEAGFAGVILDTADDAGGLLDRVGIAGLQDFIAACRARRLMVGVAGSLEAPDIPRLLLLDPDTLGFRGALAGHGPAGQIDADAVAMIRGMIPLDPRSAAHRDPQAAKVDYRLLASRGYAAEPGKGAPLTDRVLVRDFVLPVSIGTYEREREKPQNVCFNVQVNVLRPGHAVEDMRDVFSYDVVTDGIRVIAAGGHVPLIEILAERVAALILAHPRVVSVTVRAEKLDVGQGAVGIEIVRERAPEAARVHQLYPVDARETNPKVAD